MKKKRSNFGYYIKEGVSSIFTHRLMSFASVGIIMACLLIMGAFSVILVNINAVISQAENKNEITAYVDEALTDDEAVALQIEVERTANVSGVDFVTREEAMEAFYADYQDEYFEEVPVEVFRHRYVVSMDDIALMDQTKTDLEAIDGIAKVVAPLQVAQGFITVRNIVGIVSGVLIVVLLVISIFIIANTTKLATFDRREEIAIMKMVGATNSFIRWPFVFQGFILGIFAGLLAFVILWGGYELIGDWIMASSIGGIISVVSFSALSQNLLIAFIGTGFLVGVLGSVITIRNYLKV